MEWIGVKERLPENDDMVLAIVSGRPEENIFLIHAYELAAYGPEGWILQMWPEWMDADVTHWTPLPMPPKEITL